MEKVCVLMSTYNGEKYLNVQINSILNQKDIAVKLIVRDDGSKDSTVSILNEYAKEGKLEFYIGENLKPAHSFMELLYKAPEYDYYAFADQDDFWLENKLKVAIEHIKKNDNKECLYFSNVLVVDDKLRVLESKKQESNSKISLATSFVHSPAIGCTMVLNKEMRSKIIEKNIINLEIGMHDSWIYRVGLAIDAKIIFDNSYYIKYRQHDNNVIGNKSNKSIKSKLKDIFEVRKKIKSDIANNILNLYRKDISEGNKSILNKIGKFSTSNRLFDKFAVIFDDKFKSLNVKSNIKFVIDVMNNRI